MNNNNYFLNKTNVLICFYIFILIIFFTHIGALSPYTWGCTLHNWPIQELDGHPVDQDVHNRFQLLLTNFFYEPSCPDFSRMIYIDSPLHSFLTSIFLGITRSLLLSYYIVNLIFLLLFFLIFINFLSRFNLSYSVILFSGINILFLPFFTHYAGQPMHYIAENIINFVVIMSIIDLILKNSKKPISYGLLTSILLINFDFYPYIIALVTYFLFFYKLENFWKYLLFSLMPFMLWKYFLYSSSTSPLSLEASDFFLKIVVPKWELFLFNPIKEFCYPFIITHIGLTLAFKMIISHIYWPLLLFVAFHFLKHKPDQNRYPFVWLLYLIPCAFFLIMMIIIPFDGECNPRRVIPFLFAFWAALIYVISKIKDNKGEIYLLLFLTIMSFTLSFSDTLFKTPVIHNLQMSESMRSDAKYPFWAYEKKLTIKSMPTFPQNKPIQLFNYPRAKFDTDSIGIFIFSQIFCFSALVIFFYFLQRLELVKLPLVFTYTLIYILSLILRFIL